MQTQTTSTREVADNAHDIIRKLNFTLATKLDRTHVEKFESTVNALPSLTQMNTLTAAIDSKLETFDRKLGENETRLFRSMTQIDDQIKIIHHYDEIMCEKASKHSLELFKEQFIQGNKDF